MHSYPQEFLLLCRQLGEAQQRCSATLAAQAAQIEALQAEVVRLRGAVVLRDTRLGWVHEALALARAAEPGLPRRKAMARHIAALAERIGALSRECLRWRLAAEVSAIAVMAPARKEAPALGATHGQPAAHAKAVASGPFGARVTASGTDGISAGLGVGAAVGSRGPTTGARTGASTGVSAAVGAEARAPLDVLPEAFGELPLDALGSHGNPQFAASLAAADLVICQTGCISHDEYWRVQDHCRRTGKPCILVDQPLAVQEAHAPGHAQSPSQATATTEPAVILRMTRPRRDVDVLAGVGADSGGTVKYVKILNEIGR